jgi:hypothetical protein
MTISFPLEYTSFLGHKTVVNRVSEDLFDFLVTTKEGQPFEYRWQEGVPQQTVRSGHWVSGDVMPTDVLNDVTCEFWRYLDGTYDRQ